LFVFTLDRLGATSWPYPSEVGERQPQRLVAPMVMCHITRMTRAVATGAPHAKLPKTAFLDYPARCTVRKTTVHVLVVDVSGGEKDYVGVDEFDLRPQQLCRQLSHRVKCF